MAEARKIQWGILGTKFISSQIAEAIQKSDTSELLAIGSRDIDRAFDFSKKHNVKKYYANYDELLLDPEIDVVYIGLPNHLHKEWIIRCAKAGKHILCEKPFVLNMEEAREALNAVKKYNVFCMEALMYYCHPFIDFLETFVESKKIGDMQCITATYNVNIFADENKIAGGAIRCLGCYPASLVRRIAKEEPEHIQALGKLDKTGRNDNISIVSLSFKSGLTATITTSDTIDWWWQFTIFGTKGILDVKTNPWLPGQNNQVMIKIDGKEEIINFTADKPLYTYQIDCVGEHVKNKLMSPSKSGVTWEHTWGNIVLLEAWLMQVKQHKTECVE